LEAEAELSSEAATRQSPVQPVIRRRSNRSEAHPPSNRRV